MPQITKDFLSVYHQALSTTLIITQHNKTLLDSDKLQVKITLLYLQKNNELLLGLINELRKIGSTDRSLRRIACWKNPPIEASTAISKVLLDYPDFDVENSIDMLSFYQAVFLNLKNEPYKEYSDYIHTTINFHKCIWALTFVAIIPIFYFLELEKIKTIL